jgi:hypothetical protein
MMAKPKWFWFDTYEDTMEWLLLVLAAINLGVYSALFWGWLWTGTLVMAMALLGVVLLKVRSYYYAYA